MMKTLLRQFGSRDQHTPFVQFIKYGISGGIATLVHVACFYTLATTLFPALTPDDIIARFLNLSASTAPDAIRARNSTLDNVIAFMASNLAAYLINIAWVFKPGRHHPFLEFLFFYLWSGISIGAGSLIMWLLIHLLGLATTFAFIVNVVVCLLINFIVRKHLVFKE
jgi:putative flippase GtrA